MCIRDRIRQVVRTDHIPRMIPQTPWYVDPKVRREDRIFASFCFGVHKNLSHWTDLYDLFPPQFMILYYSWSVWFVWSVWSVMICYDLSWSVSSVSSVSPLWCVWYVWSVMICIICCDLLWYVMICMICYDLYDLLWSVMKCLICYGLLWYVWFVMIELMLPGRSRLVCIIFRRVTWGGFCTPQILNDVSCWLVRIRMTYY